MRDKFSRQQSIDEDISFQSPKMTEKERLETLKAFGDHRRKSKATTSGLDKLRLQLLCLKIEMKNFVKSSNGEQDFGFFLDLYMKSMGVNGKVFSEEMGLQPAELSQVLRRHRDPNEKFMVRLEIHSNNNFPAALWYSVLAKQKELELKNDTSLRVQEARMVKPKYKFKI